MNCLICDSAMTFPSWRHAWLFRSREPLPSDRSFFSTPVHCRKTLFVPAFSLMKHCSGTELLLGLEGLALHGILGSSPVSRTVYIIVPDERMLVPFAVTGARVLALPWDLSSVSSTLQHMGNCPWRTAVPVFSPLCGSVLGRCWSNTPIPVHQMMCGNVTDECMLGPPLVQAQDLVFVSGLPLCSGVLHDVRSPAFGLTMHCRFVWQRCASACGFHCDGGL